MTKKKKHFKHVTNGEGVNSGDFKACLPNLGHFCLQTGKSDSFFLHFSDSFLINRIHQKGCGMTSEVRLGKAATQLSTLGHMSVESSHHVVRKPRNSVGRLYVL